MALTAAEVTQRTANAQNGQCAGFSGEYAAPRLANEGLDAALAPAPEAHDWVPPGQVEEFQVLAPLGRGGMGHVYLGHDTQLDRPVALKFIAGDPDLALRGRFLVEARAIARLSHPNVVAIYRIGDVLGRPYIAYEFIAGQSLDQLAKPLPWPRVLELAVGLARGLAAAHRAGIVHRDIKPANLMLTSNGAVKLLDFGLAKLALFGATEPARTEARVAPARQPADQAETVRLRHGFDASADTQRGSPSSQRDAAPASGPRLMGTPAPPIGPLTEPGLVLGTPLYAAPEVWAGISGTPADVYSLGLVLHELCTGAPPRGLIGPEGRLHDPALRDPAPLRRLVPEVPEALAELVDRCLRRVPHERFASASELCEALEGAERFLRLIARNPSSPAAADLPHLLASSFARLSPHMLALSEAFYARLFEEAPSIRPLFPTDLGEQKLKLAGALELTIEHLGRPERLTPLLEELGRRHARYGVRGPDFDLVGRCLLETIAEFEAAHFTPTLEQAWGEAYAQISQAMQRGLASATPSSRRPEP
jgi:serine/threonine protein kinase